MEMANGATVTFTGNNDALVGMPPQDLHGDELRTELRRISLALEREKSRTGVLVDAVERAVASGLMTLTLPPIPPPRPQRSGAGAEEVAVAVLSDWQLAKTTATYDSEICEARVEMYAEKVMKLADVQRADHPVNELRVWLLGDLIESELIFPGQAHRIDSSLYRQITVDGPRILTTFLRRMAQHFERVRVVGIIGNHGAISGQSRRENSPETNGDRMLYRICQQILANEPRISWDIPDGGDRRNWYAVDTVGSYSTLLFHGDQVRGGFGGFPFYGLAKKVWGWKSGAIPEQFDDVFFGHFHQPTRITLNSVTARCSGSIESHNDWAMEELAAVGRPSQWLLFVKPDFGVTAEYCVWLDDENLF
jgi:hypothetical protein